MYYTYMLRCSDNSIYTGITTDLSRRMAEHSAQGKTGAKYTKSRTPLRIEAAFASADRKSASALEYRIKRLSKQKKELLISDNHRLEDFLSDKLDTEKYETVKLP